jgi:hypothetical protein
MFSPDPSATFGPWSIGDTIVGDLSVPYVDDDEAPVDFTGYTVTSAHLRHPDGTTDDLVAAPSPDGTALVFTLAAGPFETPGIWQIEATLTNVDGAIAAVVPLQFIVEAVSGWLTLSQVRANWRDAPANDVLLWRLLDVARIQVEAWAPDPTPEVIPSNYISAQYTQARNVWNAVKSDPATSAIGDEGLLLRPFPLDWTVKNMIRPKVAKSVVA